MRLYLSNKTLSILLFSVAVLFFSSSPLSADQTLKNTAPATNQAEENSTDTNYNIVPNSIRNLMLVKNYIAASVNYLKNKKKELAVTELSYVRGILAVVGKELTEASPRRFLKIKECFNNAERKLSVKNLEELSSSTDELIRFLRRTQGKPPPPSWDSVFIKHWTVVQNYVFVVLGLAVLWLLFSQADILKKQGWKRMGILMVVVSIPVLLEGIGRVGILTGISMLTNLSFMTNEYSRLFFALIIVFAIFLSRMGFRDIRLAEERLENLNQKLKATVDEQTKEISFLLDATTKTSQTQDLDEIIKLFSEMLIRSFACHTFSRVAVMDRSAESFEIKNVSTIRQLKVNHQLNESFKIDDFPFLKKALADQDIRMIADDSNILADNEKTFLFQEQFKTSLILPFIYGRELLGFGMVSEARSPERSHFSKTDIEFYKTLANHLGVSIHNAQLFAKNKSIFLNTIRALAAAVDARDAYTLYHSRNVTEYSVKIAEEMDLSDKQLANLKTAGLLHDIGKIGIKDEILLKSGKLSEEEFKEFSTHPAKAVKILESVDELEGVIEIIAHHHERYDGTGYPGGVKADDIPIESRIIAVADSFDAMTSSRLYRKPLKPEEAIEEIKKCSGTQFDAQVVEAFLSAAPSFAAHKVFDEES